MPTPFQLKTFPEILQAMFATARAQLDPDIDLNIGSILRAIFEAASLSDAEQYVMISKLLDLFSRAKTRGEDLDRRALDYGAAVFSEMRRREANTSISYITTGATNLAIVKTTMTGDVAVSATSVELLSATGWPVSGSVVLERGTFRQETVYFTRSGTTLTIISPATGVRNPHVAGGTVELVGTVSLLAAGIAAGVGSCQLQAGTETAWPASGSVIFERDTIRREIRTFTRVGTTLTLGAVTGFAHAISTDVTLSTFGSDRAIAAGSICYVPESVSTTRVLFRTTSAGTLKDGDLMSDLIPIESDGVGSATRVGSNTITQWQSAPFALATVTNPLAATRGRDREDDDTYNSRISAFIQSLSRATALAIETLVAGQQDPFTESVIAFAQTVEPVAPGESLLYVTDGTTTFNIDSQVKTGRVVLVNDARASERRARLPDYGPFSKLANPVGSRTPRLFKNEPTGFGVATSVGVNFLEDNTKAWTINQFVGMWMKTDDGVFYQVASNTAIRLTLSASGATPSLGQFAVFNLAADPLIPDTDYVFNQSNGDLELTVALSLHESLIAADDGASGAVGAYTYTRGLAAHAQRLVNGDRTDLDNFPGIKALGTHCRVVVPTVVASTITIQVITDAGLTDASLASTVQSVVQSYVNGLGIGESVLISEITRLVKGLAGVRDCRVLSPTVNVNVADGQIARINASDVVVV